MKLSTLTAALATAALMAVSVWSGYANATIPTPTTSVVDSGNGVTTAFNYNFIIPYQADGVTPAVTVFLTNTTTGAVTPLALTTNYTISGVGNSAGGTVTYNPGTPLPAGNTITIQRSLAYIQPTAVANVSFYPHTVEQVADNLDMQIQQLATAQGLTPVETPYPVVSCVGGADQTATINAAFARSSLVIISGNCYSATGIVAPPNSQLIGQVFAGGNPVGGSIISCPATSAIVCVEEVGAIGANGLLPNAIENLSIEGVGTPVSGFVGLEFYNGYSVTARNVKVSNADTCAEWVSGSVTSGGIHFTGINFNAAQCKTHYEVFNGWPEAYFSGGRLGDNGSGDFAASDAILIENTTCQTSGCGPNTLTWDGTQINPGNSLGCAFRFANMTYTSGFAGEYKFSHGHIEWHTSGGTAVFCSDSTVTLLQQLMVDHTVMSLGSASVPLFALNSATGLKQDTFDANDFGGCTGIPLAPSPASGAAFSDVHFTGNFGCSSASFTSNGTGGNLLYSDHNNWNALTIGGLWDDAFYSNDYFGSGITDTATGNVFMVEPPQTWTPKLNLCSSIGCGTSAGTQASWGQYQRLPTGGWTASFSITMSGTPGSTGFLEVDGEPLACSNGNQAAAAGFVPGTAFNFAGALNSAPIITVDGGAPPQFLVEETNASNGTTSAIVQAPHSVLTSTTALAATVSCTQAK